MTSQASEAQDRSPNDAQDAIESTLSRDPSPVDRYATAQSDCYGRLRANSEALQSAIQNLVKSRNEFWQATSQKELIELQQARENFEMLLRCVNNYRSTASETDPAAVLTTRLRGAYDRSAEIAFRLSKHLDAMSAAAPMYVQAAWSVVHVLLMAQVNDLKIKEYIREHLSDISLTFETMHALAAYAPTKLIVQALTEVYARFLDFLNECLIFLMDSGIKRAFKAVAKPLESRLQPIVDDMKKAIRRLESRAQVAIIASTSNINEGIIDVRERLMQVDANVAAIPGMVSRAVVDGLINYFHNRSEILEDFGQRTTSNEASGTGQNRELDDENRSTMIDDLCSVFQSEPRISSATSATNARREQTEHDVADATAAEILSLQQWLESDISHLLWIDVRGPYEQLAWNMHLIEPAISDFMTSRPHSTIIKCFCGDLGIVAQQRTPTAVLQRLIVQLIGQHQNTLEQSKNAPSLDEFQLAKSDFRLTAQIFDRCIDLCGPKCLLIVVQNLEQLDCPSDGSASVNEMGSIEGLRHTLDSLMQKSWLLTKILFTSTGSSQSRPPEDINSLSITAFPSQTATNSMQALVNRSSKFGLDLFNGAQRRVAFADLHILYRPNTIVYSRSQDSWQAYLIVDIGPEAGPDLQARKMLPLVLRCWRTQHVGGKLCRVFEMLQVQNYTGARLIESLDLIPAAFLSNESDIRAKLMHRGSEYCHYSRGVHYREISGSYAQKYSIDGVCRVVIDMATYTEQIEPRASSRPSPDTCFELLQDDSASFSNFKPIVYITSPRRIPAYDLERNTWFDAEVERLQDVPHCGEGILHDLNLDHKTMDTLADTAEAYLDAQKVFKNVRFTDSEYMTRNVGMLALLHGPPASGMTYTVEALAEVYARPLVRVMGNLIMEDNASQQQLRRIFEYARRWNAFVILKDVDIFFQEDSRGSTSVSYAALASLVRELVQSFPGLLYIVTHRVAKFDASHLSLFAITVPFESWTPQRRFNALINLLAQVGFDEKAEDWHDVRTWLEEELSHDENFDIRRMKNFVAVATIRARAGGGPVRRYELKHAAQMTSNFSRLMINQRLQQASGTK